jgi:CDP-diacylglycerol--serine O-phosphatidyltransferase
MLKPMKRMNFLPNAITTFGLACGLFVIFRVNMMGNGTFELLYHMTLILLLSGLADLLDGAVARAVKGESEFGLVFDSLSDAICFGVAPSVLFLKFLSVPQEKFIGFLALASAMIYTVCGVLRLVRFNLKAVQKKDLEEEKSKSSTFVGLPIPAAAAAVISPNLLLNTPYIEELFALSLTLKAIILSIISIAIAYLMISKFRFPSLKSVRFKIRSFNLVFFGTLTATIFLYGLLNYLPIVLIVLAWGYIFVSLALSLIRIISGRRTKSLADFEPANDEEEEDEEEKIKTISYKEKP